jgi:hypothetical protein
MLTLHLPAEITTAAERASYAEKLKQRKGDPLSGAQRERMTALLNEHTDEAVVRIEAAMAGYREAAGDRKNAVVAYTEGIHAALTLMLANLWADFNTCVAFARDERLALEKRVQELEQRPSIEYRGVWSSFEDYKIGNACTYDGSLWIATADNKAMRPGEGTGAAWKLAVKRGRDGRDSR